MNFSYSVPKSLCTGLLPSSLNQLKHSCQAANSSLLSPRNLPSLRFSTQANVFASCNGLRRMKFTSPVLCAYVGTPPATCAS